MSVTVILGAQFGDEAKGKIADYLAGEANLVVRTGGGPNAGHSIHLAEGAVVLHQVPTGVLRHGVTSIDGPGMVVDPFGLETEMQELDGRGLFRGKLLLSDRAHLILPLHRLEDAWEEELRSKQAGGTKFGTTLRGIGPAYADRAARFGVRMADLLRPEVLRVRLAPLYASKAHLPDRPELERMFGELVEVGRRLAPRIQPTEPVLWEALRKGERILLEGAQSALLDVDFGTYPYVTSSHPTSAGALLGSGLPPQSLDAIVAVTKAYCTRVGEGPFPTEESGELGEYLRREGNERGATTGRPRRCGWLDLVLLRYGSLLNGFTSYAMTKVDVLAGLDEVPVCVAYEDPSGNRIADAPPTMVEDFAQLTPVYERLPGWPEFNARLKERIHREGPSALPSELRRFLAFVEQRTGVPVEFLSYGPRRDETLRLAIGQRSRAIGTLMHWS